MQWWFFELTVTGWVLLGTFYTWLSQHPLMRAKGKINTRGKKKKVRVTGYSELLLATRFNNSKYPQKEAVGTSITFFHKLEGQVTSPQSQTKMCSF